MELFKGKKEYNKCITTEDFVYVYMADGGYN